MTSAQCRHLHAIARELGLDHEQLRDACGVRSLTHLSQADAHRAIARLAALRQNRERPPAPRLVNSPHAPATPKQRKLIGGLLRELEKLCGVRWSRANRGKWIFRQTRNLGEPATGVDCPKLTVRQASHLINRLDAAVRREARRCRSLSMK